MSTQETALSTGWEFVRGKASRAWLAGKGHLPDTALVDLPHCWNTRDTFQDGLRYYRGHGSYRKRVAVPQTTTRQWTLTLGNFFGYAELFLDGERIPNPTPTGGGAQYRFDGNFIGCTAPLTLPEQSTCMLGFRLDNRHDRHQLPGIPEPDFVLHGGLAGSVSLHPKELRDFFGDGAEVQADVSGRVQVRVTGLMPEQAYMLSIWDGLQPIDSNICTGADLQQAPPTLQVDQPIRWSLDQPHLYTLKCTWSTADGERESAIRIGFRDAEWRPGEGFFLNGQRVDIRGINRHEKMPGMGHALPPGMHREDARLIKELGLNAVRLSHYPQAPDFLDACDELGILVYAEIATWKSMKRGRWLRNAKGQLERMIRRDRHHPSLICWGLGNETRDAKAYAELHACAKQLDPERPTIYAENHLYRAQRKKSFASTDLYGVNYELAPEVLEDARKLSSKQLLLVSEMSNCPKWRGDLAGELEQLQVLSEDLEKIAGRSSITGFMIWCMNDYATMRKDRYRRPSGMFDAWRMPKFAAHYLRARFGETPYLYAWADWSRPGEATRAVQVFTNQASVQIDGRAHEVTPGHAAIDQAFVDQPLTLSAGDEVYIIQPFGSPQALTLTPEVHPDFIRIVIQVVDAAGHPVLTAQGQATVQVNGALQVHAWNPEGRVDLTRGEAAVYVGIPDGAAHVTVEMPGLPAAALSL
ncbi:MAG: hypothetical protein ACI9TH_002971 [Kiritimatiellia bacterium]|jgi:hypothetical protein